MDIDREFARLMFLCERDLAEGKEVRYFCPYCGVSLAGLFKKKSYYEIDEEEIDFEDEEIYCPCCGQSGAF